MIHVCYAMQDDSGKYSKFVGTSIFSLLENTREDVTIHLLHDSTLSNKNREKLLSIDSTIKFYNVDELAPDQIAKIENQFKNLKDYRPSIACFYRLIMPDILPKNISRIIYIDADTIVNLDIA